MLAGIGIALGSMTTSFASVECGSAFSPDYDEAKYRDALGNALWQDAGYASDDDDALSGCEGAISTRKTFAFGLLGVGAVSGLMAIAIPATRRD